VEGGWGYTQKLSEVMFVVVVIVGDEEASFFPSYIEY